MDRRTVGRERGLELTPRGWKSRFLLREQKMGEFGAKMGGLLKKMTLQ